MARSEVASSAATIRRSEMPVRVTIQSSLVSTIFSRSKLVSTRSGTWAPTPAMPAPRSGVGRSRPASARDLSADLIDNPMLHRFSGGADRVRDRPPVRSAVADDADAVDPEQRGATVLRIVGSTPDAAQRRREQPRRELEERALA